MIAAAMVAAALIGGSVGLVSRPRPVALTLQVPSPASSSPAGRVVVHVSGWVKVPGVVELPEGSRVVDAVAAAGGALPGADLGAVNLAEPLVDGGRVLIPGPGQTDGEAVAVADGRVRVNQATAAELETLPGVGPVLAERIVAYREQNGPFSTVEDLLGVSGIGERTLEELRPLVIVP